ncbi:MAG: tetratricopeptide repeat protein [Deltaproteobacteria bacterium]|jgi:tetratricopeptide (TPR) repeat protein|nr:tetratricopeptide repeat protein [Deltaproteobacteria bacterium]
MLKRIESAEIAYLSGRTQEALADLTAIAAEDPENHRARLSLGVIYHALGQFEEAGNCFSRILESDPDNVEATVDLVLTHISQKDFVSAKNFLSETLAKDDGNFFYWNLLSKVEAALDNFSSSIACARKSLALNPAQSGLPMGTKTLDSNKIMSAHMFRRHAEQTKKKMRVFLNETPDPELNLLLDGLAPYFDIERVMSFKYGVYRDSAGEADVIWLEGLSNNSVYFLNDAEHLKNKLVIARLSREDVLGGAASKVSFANASLVTFESYFLRDLFLRDNPKIRDESSLQVFLKMFDAKDYDHVPRYGNKRIASVLPDDIAPAEFILLLEAFLVINRKFPETELHIDRTPRNLEKDFHANQFLTENGMGYKVHFHARESDPRNFLNENHCILSAETFAGGPGNLEALMLGLKPLIRSSPGAMELYHEHCLWKNVTELPDLYENPPDTMKISGCVREIHKTESILPQYVQKFITLKWC